MLKKILVLLLFSITVVAFSYEPSTITVNVFGQIVEESSNKVIEIDILESGEDSKIASKKAIEKNNLVTDALLSLGIEKSAISSNSNHQSYTHEKEYFVRRIIKVTINSDVDLDKLYKKIIEAGAAGYNDTDSYRHLDRGYSESETEAPKSLEEAVLLAEKKAKVLAKAFNAQIGRIVAIKELSYGPHSDDAIAFEVTYELIY